MVPTPLRKLVLKMRVRLVLGNIFRVIIWFEALISSWHFRSYHTACEVPGMPQMVWNIFRWLAIQWEGKKWVLVANFWLHSFSKTPCISRSPTKSARVFPTSSQSTALQFIQLLSDIVQDFLLFTGLHVWKLVNNRYEIPLLETKNTWNFWNLLNTIKSSKLIHT